MIEPSVTVYPTQIAELQRLLGGVSKKIKRELAIAVNETAKHTKGTIAKQIVAELAVAQKVVKDKLTIKRANNADRNPTAKVTLDKTKRIPLRDFGARQNKTGVSVKISKSRGRKTIPSAFMVDRYGDHVYKRSSKARAVGRRKKGPSPWGVFVKNNLKEPTADDAKDVLRKNVERRIRFIKLKQSGAIS